MALTRFASTSAATGQASIFGFVAARANVSETRSNVISSPDIEIDFTLILVTAKRMTITSQIAHPIMAPPIVPPTVRGSSIEKTNAPTAKAMSANNTAINQPTLATQTRLLQWVRCFWQTGHDTRISLAQKCSAIIPGKKPAK